MSDSSSTNKHFCSRHWLRPENEIKIKAFCASPRKNHNSMSAFFLLSGPSHHHHPLPRPLQPVPSGRTALAVPRNAAACGNIPLAATRGRGAASAGLHTGAPAARKVRGASREAATPERRWAPSNHSPAPLQVGLPPSPNSSFAAAAAEGGEKNSSFSLPMIICSRF